MIAIDVTKHGHDVSDGEHVRLRLPHLITAITIPSFGIAVRLDHAYKHENEQDDTTNRS